MNPNTEFNIESSFLLSSSNNSLEVISFFPFREHESLPFPLYHSDSVKTFISIVLTITLALGLKFRITIISYLLAPDTKMGPINYLIWLDQINGLFLGLVILFRIITINISRPLRLILSPTMCEWSDLPGVNCQFRQTYTSSFLIQKLHAQIDFPYFWSMFVFFGLKKKGEKLLIK